MSLIRGVLLAGRFRSQRDLNGMRPDDQRNTLITELAGRTSQPVRHYQAMDDVTLAGAGAILVFIREAGIRDDAAIRTMSDDDLRNTAIVEITAVTGRPNLQGLSNSDLVRLGLRGDNSYIKGVIMMGRFRTFRQLNAMSADDQRNTLITELAGRTSQPVRHYQAMDDVTLAGAGAILVFIREAGIRDDAAIRTMSDDDLRNTAIVEIAAQPNFPRNNSTGPTSLLQGFANLELIGGAFGDFNAVIVRVEAARNSLLAKYHRIGGLSSPLGLPTDPQMPVVNAGQTLRMDFRGGQIEIPAGGGEPVAVKRFRAEVWWMGLECQIRQEGTDEIYGGIGVIVPGSGLSKTEKFSDDGEGTWDMGPSGTRMINTARLLYNGPPMDIVLTAALVEHDSGDTSAAKQKIAGAVSAAAMALGGAVGVPAEALSAGQGWVNDLSLGLVNGVADLFGMNDDAYPPQQLRLRWPEIQSRQFTRQTARRNDDPRTIDYTHLITVSGVDEAGDRGQYAVYFDVRLFEEREVLHG